MTNAHRIISPFAYRNLEWVISSPFLLKNAPSPDLAAHPETTDLLVKLQSDATPLLDHLEATRTRNLGHYFEQLVTFWLSRLPSIEMIGSNIQIFREKRSLGELDLVFTYAGKAYHWELAVKFYLNIGSGLEEKDYVGPMLKDTLQKKLDRVENHQLLLPSELETRKKLEDLDVGKVISHPWIKGCLFDQIPKTISESVRPPRISQNSRSGHWLGIQKLEQNNIPEFDHFLLLEKERRITPYFYPEEAKYGKLPELRRHIKKSFQNRLSPILIALMRDDGQELLANVGYHFITPENWPELPGKADNRQKLRD